MNSWSSGQTKPKKYPRLNQAEKEREKEQNTGATGNDKNEKLWFDIEKSQKRYEDLLDKHKQVAQSY